MGPRVLEAVQFCSTEITRWKAWVKEQIKVKNAQTLLVPGKSTEEKGLQNIAVGALRDKVLETNIISRKATLYRRKARTLQAQSTACAESSGRERKDR